MRIARSRYDGSRYFSQVSAGSRTWPSASTTRVLTEVVVIVRLRDDDTLGPPKEAAHARSRPDRPRHHPGARPVRSRERGATTRYDRHWTGGGAGDDGPAADHRPELLPRRQAHL